jgi:hypothetical protein
VRLGTAVEQRARRRPFSRTPRRDLKRSSARVETTDLRGGVSRDAPGDTVICVRRAGACSAILLAVLVAGCASHATTAHSFLRVTEQRRGESLAIRVATQSEANIARTTKSRVTSTPTRCAGVEVSAARLTCSVTFEVADGSDEHKVTVVLDPKTGVMTRTRHELIALDTQFIEK